MVRRVILTGANGTGKSYVASRFHNARPEIPVISFDAIKLTREWQQRPRSEINHELARIVAMDAWILEGGPSLLFQALPRAEVVIWLDPPELTRAWRLAIRPWRNLGKTRAELPAGNSDWPIQQYRFALRSIRDRSKFRDHIVGCLDGHRGADVWHCRSNKDVKAALKDWRGVD